MRLYGMRLGDGPEYEFEKIDEITERDVILVLENSEGEVVRIPMAFETSEPLTETESEGVQATPRPLQPTDCNGLARGNDYLQFVRIAG